MNVNCTSSIYTYTIIHNSAPEFSRSVPYMIGLIESGGQKILASIIGWQEFEFVEIGDIVDPYSKGANGIPVYQIRGSRRGQS